MAAIEIVHDTLRVHRFVLQYCPLPFSEDMQGLGLVRDGELVAGVIYEGFTGHCIWMHVAAIPGRKWLNRQYLRVCFAYPFQQLGVRRIFGWVPAENEDARRFDEHLGFRQHAVISGASMTGGDVLIYVMDREECRYGQEEHQHPAAGPAPVRCDGQAGCPGRPAG